jgi:hypothetical protein
MAGMFVSEGRVGFRNDTVLKVKQGLFRVLRKKVDQVISTQTAIVQESFNSFSPKKPIETGRTRDTTDAQAIFGNERAIIRFKSANAQRRDYAVFPLLGLSTSKKYGVRNWLEKSAKITIRELKKSNSIFK